MISPQLSDEMVKAAKKSPSGGKKSSKKSSGSKRSSLPSPPAADAKTDAATLAGRPDAPSLGMRTSSIANKLVRKEQYAKLKHKQKVKFVF